jgi:PAB-dependent poly(A)-specific ribonuclease subunit 2
VIAIDAEFVTIRRPEFQMDPAGNTIQIRPIGHALARVSVLRGPSPEFDPSLEPGTPFIDDYIVASEPIIDYVTSFSGLSAGDLHMSTSRHDLLTFKTVYKKLWILLNLGCKFLGHGLKTDFRVINMIVPKSQVIDTIDLFYLRDRRQGGLALKYLMWAVFNGEEIQSETHDSIEDARAALRLWAKWREWVDAGIQQVYLDEIYSKGKGLGYKVPNGGSRGDNSHDDGGTPKGTPRKNKK